MSRVAVIPGVLLFVGTILLPCPARADTIAITITGGSLTSTGGSGAFVSLEGGTRLTLDAAGGNGLFEPWLSCDGTPDLCGPGAEVPLQAHWSGSDFTGTATLDGRAFSIGLGSLDQGSASVTFTGSFTTPLFTGVDRLSVFAPFSFTGLLFESDREDALRAFLTGGGTARIDLAWTTVVGGAWHFQGARYEFERVSDPIPEPATMMLVGSGILGCAAAHRRRRRRTG
jgi:hypothetical protein